MAESGLPSRVLVVDDDAGLLILIESALRAERWNVAMVDSGRAALDWIQRHPVDLMLLDLKLSDMECRELIDRMVASGRSVPFMIITGQGDERVAVDLMKRGALDYLVKDVNFIEFLPTLVRRALAQVEHARRLVEAERKLRESAERYRLVVEMAGTVVLLLGKDGKVLEWSGEAERIYGCSATEAVGSNYLLRFLPDAERPRVAKELEQVFDGQPTVGFENPVITQTGRIPTFLWNASLLKDADGHPLGALSVGHDITERKKLEQELLEIAEREQRKFGHDLHDGLGQRLTGLEMLSHALSEDLESRHPALAKDAKRLNRELRETVTMVRLISHSLAPVPLDGEGLMRALAELAASTARLPNVKCEFECGQPVRIEDVKVATHLYRISQEAVNNALKHGRARYIRISLKALPDGLELAVENDGAPMAEGEKENRGVGLSLMKYRADMIGGALNVHTAKSKGVKVVCTLQKPV